MRVTRAVARVAALVFAVMAVLSGNAAESASAPGVDMEQASHFARMSLAGLDREYPNKPNELLTGPADLKTPRELHPAFWGHFDWHSSVHAHWMLVRVLRLHPELAEAAEIRTRIGAHLTKEHLLAEAAYFESRHNQSFERMYGWAWLLRLAQELRGFDDPDARAWAANLRPLEERIVALTEGYLPRLTYPVRSGIHPDTAWALAQMIDYARATGNTAFEELLLQRAKDYYGKDADYPTTFEPSGQDFFSPGLNVADLMRRVLKPKAYSSWLNRFAPGLRRARLGAWATPAVVSDLEDPQIVHLVGLNLSRASAMQGIASALDPRDRRRRNLEQAMQAHAAVGLPLVSSGHYEGEHWLASFAVYYLTSAGLAGGKL
jgi:hypothetical protein